MLFDKEQLLDDIGGDDELVQKVLDCAALEIPKEVEKLRVCCAGSDTEAIRIQAHGIKSIAADLYAAELRESCAKVESAAKDGNLERARAMLPELEQVAKVTVGALYESP
ncbi:MAG TPA: Hpt domain-containing protein [Desulfuromonadales bacterium]|nr:Hpt domain-containing protein [Desulfuromonadales bacterium]